MILAAVLLGLAQDPAADQTLRRIEEVFTSAKTLSLKFTSSESTGQEKTQGKGTLLMKGNRLRLEHRLKSGGRDLSFDVYSDGRTLILPLGGPSEPRPVPASLGAAASRAFVRLGFLASWFPLRRATAAESAEEIEALLKNLCEVTDVRYGAADGEARSLTYKIPESPLEAAMTAKLWYDPKTYRLITREIERAGSAGIIRITESYEAGVVDADLEEGAFKLPPSR